MQRAIIAATIAGLAASAAGQGVSLTFTADQSVVDFGDTVHWTVTAEFTGYEDPTAYFAGFVGTFFASDETLGLVTGTSCPLLVAADPVITGATIWNIDFLCWSALGNNDPSNPIVVYEFDVDITAYDGSLSYEPVGVASVFPSDDVIVLSDDYTDFAFGSDTVTIGFGCSDADLAEPWGVLDSADITAFVGAFLAEDPRVDLDANEILDLADIVGFVEAFNAGCP
jgi:hypothetical protein